ncbi:hypothetical protein G7046_g2489 [Stylonectria norvegica]|nr:hypothetical protein G7046_g2489 [Stylonectria norvegica]
MFSKATITTALIINGISATPFTLICDAANNPDWDDCGRVTSKNEFSFYMIVSNSGEKAESKRSMRNGKRLSERDDQTLTTG